MHVEASANENDPQIHFRLFEWRERRMFWRPWHLEGQWEFTEDLTPLFLSERGLERRVLPFFEKRYQIYLEGHVH